ncbi:dihydropteroate synthase [Desulfonauticus submarinus]|uniref:Dihydropteroate synthase n=1 Tax=Desulfonauticus submarinus TaxID=206665 RepID=A0A1H0EIL7_9BACT|nr:dihydropteroate synthase [Desulfonauticus submarinus]SDN82327.1 dihydropteroate synthase [Desulfonauticus submarinus]
MGKESIWKVRGGRLDTTPFLIVGILNATPDSFYDGGAYLDIAKAMKRVDQIIEEGGDVIDIGGESTRPYSKRVSVEEEKERVLPVIKAAMEKYPEAIISIDTYKAQVAREALELGVKIVNDVSAWEFDPELLEVIVEYKPGYVLMHSKGRPENMQDGPFYKNVIEEIKAFFEKKLNILVKQGVPEENIVLDPGIGFGKLLEHNLTILANIEKFFVFDRPIFMGLSNKSMWEKLLGLEVGKRQMATQVATALMAEKGVYIHRVHEVKETRHTLTIVKALTCQ